MQNSLTKNADIILILHTCGVVTALYLLLNLPYHNTHVYIVSSF